MLLKLTCICLLGVTLAQDYDEYRPRQAPARISTNTQEPKPTPIPILKQINRHNEDGSYTYGYEGADGSFKIETKLATGEVKGKYGYVDEAGKVRVVEYGANKYGFQPSGEGITVAPPTLVDETTDKNGHQINDYDEEPQQRPQPNKFISRPQQPKPHIKAQPRPQSQYVQYEQEEQPQYRPSFSAPAPVPQRPQSFPGAQPIDVVYSARQRPARPDNDYRQAQTFIPSPQVHEEDPEPQQQHFQQQPQAGRAFHVQRPSPASEQQQIAFGNAARAGPQPQQQQQHQPQPQQHFQQQPQHQRFSAPQAQGRSTSVLDQLAKDFALPQGGSPALHDITYTYY